MAHESVKATSVLHRRGGGGGKVILLDNGKQYASAYTKLTLSARRQIEMRNSRMLQKKNGQLFSRTMYAGKGVYVWLVAFQIYLDGLEYVLHGRMGDDVVFALHQSVCFVIVV